jgi:hypothetical protein
MILIEDNADLFDINEKQILEKKCLSFIVTHPPVKTKFGANYYVRELISNDDTEFQTIISKVNNSVRKLSKPIDIKLNEFWINKVTKNTNKDDGFHKDVSAITFLMYLNDEFTGGEYEYVIPTTKKKEKLKPKKYLSIITDRSVEHRVNPVIEGQRYSIVFFYDFDKKLNKTLI